jgi:hypothetical protein
MIEIPIPPRRRTVAPGVYRVTITRAALEVRDNGNIVCALDIRLPDGAFVDVRPLWVGGYAADAVNNALVQRNGTLLYDLCRRAGASLEDKFDDQAVSVLAGREFEMSFTTQTSQGQDYNLIHTAAPIQSSIPF